ncbi:toxin [Ornithinimicrobium cerasi]|uniref:toxin n=1 Tax=Ornithinimicrobium cerasi TaxID=2248773 RepID=UPI000EFEE0CC|nr:toxin [Ornithinimicrobium cerasi]
MKVHRSALKHGVVPEDAVQAADLSLWVEPLEEDEWPHRELRLGFDTQARLLERVVLVFRSGEEMVIHAMPAAVSSGTFCPEPNAPLCRGQ